MPLARAGSRLMSRHPPGDARSSRGAPGSSTWDGGQGTQDPTRPAPLGLCPVLSPVQGKKALFWLLFLLFCFYFSFLFSKYTCYMFFLVFIIKDL